MDEFGENPFGGPDDNPFADPSVQQVTKQTNNAQKGLEDFNPFADQPTNTRAQVHQQQQPAVMQTTMEERPTAKVQQDMRAADFQKRQEELERKAAELQRREEEIRNMTYNVRRNNWPPLPENSCGLEPCFYQDINIEIPVDFQTVVRQLYYVWIFHALLMMANIIGMIVIVAQNGQFSLFVAAFIYALVLTPFSFLCWYRPGYKAFKNDSSFNFMVFFFIFFFQFLITVIQAIGLPNGGTCGIIIAIEQFNGSIQGTITGLLSTSIALGFCAAAAMDIHRIYRSSGASMAKAQAEFTTEFLKNEHVRGAATSAASAAVNAQFQQARTPPSSRNFP